MDNFSLKPITSKEFDAYYKLLEGDFCVAERKDYKNESRALDNPMFSPSYIYHNDEVVGYICLWSFNDFLFVEHFAILEEKRNQHIGTGFLSEFLSDVSDMVILEVERPVDEIARNRIAFYEKVGFTVNPYDYIQPSYHPDNEEIPMYICSYNRDISPEEYLRFTAQIKNDVYTFS